MNEMYSLYDEVAKAFYTPFTAPNDASAARSVATACRMDNTIVSQHPADFVLYRVGSFDPATGILLPLAAPELLHRVGSLVGSDG